MTKRGDTKGWHNHGQEDAKKGKYDPAHENSRDNMFATYDKTEIEDRKAYNEGWRNQKDQKK